MTSDSNNLRVEPPVVRGIWVVAGLLAFPVLLVVIPVAWLSFSPLHASAAAWWLYVIASLVATGALVATADQSGRRRSTFIAAVSVMAVLVLGGAVFGLALDRVMAGFSVERTTARIPSPSGRLELVQREIDSGALGSDVVVTVHGRFVPGFLEWDYRLTFDPPQRLGWVDDRTVSLDGRNVRIPRPIVWLSW